MTLKSDLEKEVKNIFSGTWEVNDTNCVPDPVDLRLNSNHAKELDDATVLYADLDKSTAMVDDNDWSFCAEVYKAYLKCTSEIIRTESGVITAYDGDRVMAIFTGKSKNTNAVRAALKINYAIKKILQPALEKQYPKNNFKVMHVVGIDRSSLRAARVGVYGDNDLVWVGRAANYAAKLTELSPSTSTWITKAVYDCLAKEVKFSNDLDIWNSYSWTAMDSLTIYSTKYWWPLK
jgi:class 3 adenylate cyclase